MPTSTMTSKGQLTVPIEVRKRLHLGDGSRVIFTEDGADYRIQAAGRSAASLYGALPKPAAPLTLDEMDAAITHEALRSSHP